MGSQICGKKTPELLALVVGVADGADVGWDAALLIGRVGVEGGVVGMLGGAMDADDVAIVAAVSAVVGRGGISTEALAGGIDTLVAVADAELVVRPVM